MATTSKRERGSAKLRAKNIAKDLLKDYNYTLDPSGESYQLVHKDTGDTYSGGRGGLELDKLFQSERRLNRLVGKELAHMSQLSPKKTRNNYKQSENNSTQPNTSNNKSSSKIDNQDTQKPSGKTKLTSKSKGKVSTGQSKLSATDKFDIISGLDLASSNISNPKLNISPETDSRIFKLNKPVTTTVGKKLGVSENKTPLIESPETRESRRRAFFEKTRADMINKYPSSPWKLGTSKESEEALERAMLQWDTDNPVHKSVLDYDKQRSSEVTKLSRKLRDKYPVYVWDAINKREKSLEDLMKQWDASNPAPYSSLEDDIYEQTIPSNRPPMYQQGGKLKKIDPFKVDNTVPKTLKKRSIPYSEPEKVAYKKKAMEGSDVFSTDTRSALEKTANRYGNLALGVTDFIVQNRALNRLGDQQLPRTFNSPVQLNIRAKSDLPKEVLAARENAIARMRSNYKGSDPVAEMVNKNIVEGAKLKAKEQLSSDRAAYIDKEQNRVDQLINKNQLLSAQTAKENAQLQRQYDQIDLSNKLDIINRKAELEGQAIGLVAKGLENRIATKTMSGLKAEDIELKRIGAAIAQQEAILRDPSETNFKAKRDAEKELNRLLELQDQLLNRVEGTYRRMGEDASFGVKKYGGKLIPRK